MLRRAPGAAASSGELGFRPQSSKSSVLGLVRTCRERRVAYDDRWDAGVTGETPASKSAAKLLGAQRGGDYGAF
jgi:hypothetical protein